MWLRFVKQHTRRVWVWAWLCGGGGSRGRQGPDPPDLEKTCTPPRFCMAGAKFSFCLEMFEIGLGARGGGCPVLVPPPPPHPKGQYRFNTLSGDNPTEGSLRWCVCVGCSEWAVRLNCV